MPRSTHPDDTPMRASTPTRLLVPAAALLAAACDNAHAPQEPRPAAQAAVAPEREDVPVRRDADAQAGAQLASMTHWADGYLTTRVEDSSHTPRPAQSFNRSGRGTVTVTKRPGTTGQYVATFSGLSALLGSRSTVRATAAVASGSRSVDIACKPTAAYLVSDKVEVRCFTMGTGQPANSHFTLLTTRNYADVAFAYAHRPTSTGYSPLAAGSWNPAGTTTVTRTGVGQYRVTFRNLATRFPPDVYGHAQVSAVGTSSAHCNPYNAVTGAAQELSVDVRCFRGQNGTPVDHRFSVLFVLPAEHLAYAWADKPAAASYSPFAYYSANPAAQPITVSRLAVGLYKVLWTGLSPELLGLGNAQVSAYGSNAHCTSWGPVTDGALVHCFAPNGAAADSRFSVLRGS